MQDDGPEIQAKKYTVWPSSRKAGGGGEGRGGRLHARLQFCPSTKICILYRTHKGTVSYKMRLFN